MSRRELFNQAWSIMTRNPPLWIVALIGLAIGPILNLIFYNSDSIAAAIIITIVSFIATAFTTGALITMINRAADGQPVTVADGIQAGLQRLVPLIGLRLLLMIPVWIVLFIATGSAVVAFTSSLAQPGGIQPTSAAAIFGSIFGVVGLIIVLSLILGAISIGADRSIVLENRPVIDALKRGWELFTSNIGDYIVIGILMVIVGLAIGLLFGCAIGVLVSAIVGGQSPAATSLNQGVALSGPGLILSTVLSLIISVVLEVLFSGVWTLAYRRWRSVGTPQPVMP
jgi:hypothetical protein